MLEIKLKHVDQLHDLLMEFGVLTYLQSLVQYDKSGDSVICEPDIDIYRNSAEYYLLDKQFETVIKFKELLGREDFANSIGENIKET